MHTIERNEDVLKKIEKNFSENVKGKKAERLDSNPKHNGWEGHWLEKQMGILPNANPDADILGYEMKKQTRAKITFGDWTARYYIFNDEKYNLSRDDDFLPIFGKANEKKDGRYSWSGTPSPKIRTYNTFGQKLVVDEYENIIALYSYSHDQRKNKSTIVPSNLQQENLVLAQWDKDGAKGLKRKLERKFDQKGWFRCEKNDEGVYTSIAIGSRISWDQWIAHVKTGEIFFDSGMYQTNPRPYSMWRANNVFWDNLIIKHIE